MEPHATVECHGASGEPEGALRTSGAAEVVGGGGRVHRTMSPALTLVCFCTCARTRSISGTDAGSAQADDLPTRCVGAILQLLGLTIGHLSISKAAIPKRRNTGVLTWAR